MADRGGEWTDVTDDDGTIIHTFWWKRCEKSGCPNFICARLSPIYCYPHAGSGPTLGELIDDINKKETVNVE